MYEEKINKTVKRYFLKPCVLDMILHVNIQNVFQGWFILFTLVVCGKKLLEMIVVNLNKTECLQTSTGNVRCPRFLNKNSSDCLLLLISFSYMRYFSFRKPRPTHKSKLDTTISKFEILVWYLIPFQDNDGRQHPMEIRDPWSYLLVLFKAPHESPGHGKSLLAMLSRDFLKIKLAMGWCYVLNLTYTTESPVPIL